jgi:hypothetical protein
MHSVPGSEQGIGGEVVCSYQVGMCFGQRSCRFRKLRIIDRGWQNENPEYLWVSTTPVEGVASFFPKLRAARFLLSSLGGYGRPKLNHCGSRISTHSGQGGVGESGGCGSSHGSGNMARVGWLNGQRRRLASAIATCIFSTVPAAWLIGPRGASCFFLRRLCSPLTDRRGAAT